MMRAVRFLLLGLVLLGTQVAALAHGIEHAFHEHDEACVECLALPGMLAVPSAPLALPVQAVPVAPASAAVPPAPTFLRPLPFQSRAPPVLPH